MEREFELVFVQLGSAPCIHLWANLEQLRKEFPDIAITVIVDSLSYRNAPLNRPWKYHIHDSNSELHRTVMSKSQDSNFRSGFWFYTMMRLFAFTQYHREFPNKKLLHVESDVLLLPEFPFGKFQSLSKVSWLRVDKNRDVAALVYSPSGLESQFLENELICVLEKSSDTTDMNALFDVREKNPNSISVLPSLNVLNEDMFTLSSDQFKELRFELGDAVDYFGGIFDPSPIGIWLAGSDPRNHYGICLYNATDFILKYGSFVNPESGRYEYSRENGLILHHNSGATRIWSLHVHSKNLRLLGSERDSVLERLVMKANTGREHRTFQFGVLVRLILDNAMRGTLLRFILGHPVFQPLLRKLRILRNGKRSM